MVKLYADEFYQWLYCAENMTAEVGSRGSPWRCPLANFLRSRGHENASVSLFSYSLGGDHCDHLPKWAQRFVADFDLGVDDGVSYESCLTLMDRLLKQHASEEVYEEIVEAAKAARAAKYASAAVVADDSPLATAHDGASLEF